LLTTSIKALADTLCDLAATTETSTSVPRPARLEIKAALSALQAKDSTLLSPHHCIILMRSLPNRFRDALESALLKRNSIITDYNKVTTATHSSNTAI